MTELELIDACQEIGAVAESNGQFTRGRIVDLAGRSLEELTVDRLLWLIRQRREAYNRIMGSIPAQGGGHE